MDILRLALWLVVIAGVGCVAASVGAAVFRRTRHNRICVFDGMRDLAMCCLAGVLVLLPIGLLSVAKPVSIGMLVAAGVILVCAGVCIFDLLVTPFAKETTVSDASCSLFARLVISMLFLFALLGVAAVCWLLYLRMFDNACRNSLSWKRLWKPIVLSLIPLVGFCRCLAYLGVGKAAAGKVVSVTVFSRYKIVVCFGYAAVVAGVLLFVLSKV